MRASKEPDFQQERARRSYLALIEAATELFSTLAYDDVGTPEIAQRAKVATGTFYRYFDDKQEIYLEIVRRTFAQAYAETIEKLTPATFVGLARHETIAQTIAVLFGHILERPRLSLSFAEMALRDREVAELRQALDQLSIRRLTELVAAIVPRAVVPDPEATAFVLYGSAMQCASALVTTRLVDADRAKAALTDFIERALFPA